MSDFTFSAATNSNAPTCTNAKCKADTSRRSYVQHCTKSVLEAKWQEVLVRFLGLLGH